MNSQPTDIFPSSLHSSFSTNEALGLILNNLEESFLLVDRQLRVVLINPYTRRRMKYLLGADVNIGMSILDLVSEQRKNDLRLIYDACFSGETKRTEVEFSIDGHHCWFENNFTPVKNDIDEIIGVLVTSREITDNKKAETVLRNLEERWRFALEGGKQSVWDWNIVTGEVFFSYKRLYGYEDDEMANQMDDWQKMVVEEDRERIQAAIDEHIEGIDPFYECTYRIKTKDGSIKWILGRGMIISQDAEGKPLRMIGTHTDINDKMIAEERIRESENQYRALFHSNPLPCWIYDVHTLRLLEVNEAAVSLYGYSKEEFLSHTVLMLQQEGNKEYVKERVRLEKFTPSIEENNWCHLKKNGETIYVDLKINSIFYQNREAKLVVAQDVTAKTVMERELRQSYERFDIMMRATHDLIWDWNLETNIVYRDELGLKKVYGLSSNEQIKGIYQWLGRIHPEDQNRVEDVINDILRSSQQDTFDIEYRFRRDDNSYSFVYDRGMIIRNEAGTPVRMIGAAQDVTERKRLEQELLQNELERQKAINQATVDTQEQERSEIGKELHDNVNQVLTTTKLYLDLALTNMELKDELIQKSNRNIVSVINEIRQLSRSLMDPSIGDLGLIDSIHDLIENIHLTRKLNVSLTADKKIENLMDKNQKLTVFRIIQEALNNAIRHARANTVSIRFRAEKEFMEVQIKDDGIGFKTGFVRKGAGLKNIQNRIYLINGSHNIQSAPGNGCTIQIQFPIIK